MGLWIIGRIQIFFFMYILWLKVVLVGCKGRATCESTGPGKPGRITCLYGLNVVEARDVIAVFLLREKDGKQEKVVQCHRFLSNGFDCLPHVGYKPNGTVSDQMIINIPIALPGHEGTYYCEIGIQQTEFQMDSCYFKYQESNDSTTSAPPTEQDSDDHLEGDADTSVLIAWIITLCALLSAVLIVILILKLISLSENIRQRCRRRHDDNRWQQKKDVEKHKPMIVHQRQLSFEDTGNVDGPDKKDARQPSIN